MRAFWFWFEQQINSRSGSFAGNVYYETIDKMEKAALTGIHQRLGGRLQTIRKREERRVSDAYEPVTATVLPRRPTATRPGSRSNSGI
jgi:hypothetical protein